MADGTLVEAVALELEPVEAELEDEMAREDARGRVGEAASAKRRVDHEAVEMSDAAAPVRDRERHRARPLPVHLDHEAAVMLGLLLRPLELGAKVVGRVRRHRGQEGLHLGMRGEGDKEVDVVDSCPPEPESLSSQLAHGRGVAGTASRRATRKTPEPSATPARMRARPSTAFNLIASSRINEP